MEEEEANEQGNQLPTETDLESQILEVERMRSDYIDKGEYDNVEDCMKKIQELQHSIQLRKKREIESRQITEVDNLGASYKIEIDRVNSEWDSRIQAFEEKYQKNEEAINERQMKEMEDLYVALETKFKQTAKSSRDFLLYEQQEQQLVKLQSFKEAGVMSKKKAQQKQKDIEKWNKEKNDKIKAQAVLKSNKHLNEKNAFKRKYEIELELLRKQKGDEMKRIEKKYQNKKLELDIQQKSEMNVSDKEFTNRLKSMKIDNNAGSTEGSYHSRRDTNNQQRFDTKDNQQKNEEEDLNQNVDNEEQEEANAEAEQEEEAK